MVTKEELKLLSCEETYTKFNTAILKVYKSYFFLDLQEEEFKAIVLKVIEVTKEDYDPRMNYENYLKRKIIDAMQRIINSLDKDKLVWIIDKYINDRLKRYAKDPLVFLK